MFRTGFVHKFVYGLRRFGIGYRWHTLSMSEGIGRSVAGCHQADSHFPLHILERATSHCRTTLEGAFAKPFAMMYSIQQIGYCRRAGIERSSTLSILP
jgi:hypothetical protein